jgi:hypothetical protein
MLLWQEYKEREPSGYQYSQFCDLFRFWRGKLDLSMRQEHRAGEKMFVDYCGQTLPIVDPTTGEVRDAQVFVAVMGASNYTYAETTWSQSLADWTGSHVRTFSYFGAVPHQDGLEFRLIRYTMSSWMLVEGLFVPVAGFDLRVFGQVVSLGIRRSRLLIIGF